MPKCFGIGIKECYSMVSKDGDLCRGCQRKKLQAENTDLKRELSASNNWLKRLLKSCVILLDDGEVTKRAVEKQMRYNKKVLKQ